MTSLDLTDIDSMLQPIAGELPAGLDTREDQSASSLYQAIKNERNLARAEERQSIHDGESPQAMEHWKRVTEIAPDIIQNQSKDLEVASWYAEAMLRRYGFRGLRKSFLLIQGLVEKYWDTLHPMPDEYGIETRVSCIAGLNGEGTEGVLIAPIRKVDLTQGQDPGPFSLWQYQQSLDIQKTKDPKAKKAKIDNLGFNFEDIEKSVEASAEGFYVNLRDDITECISLFKKIGLTLDKLCGSNDAPPTRTIITTLDVCLGTIQHIGKRKFPVVESIDPSDDSADEVPGETPPTPGKKQGPISTREDAFRQLIEISDYFKKTEPHSPVSYVLEKAVRWGGMDLGELIAELITDPTSRDRYSDLTGIEKIEKEKGKK